KPYLGPDRLAWDLLNSKGIRVSPSTFRRRKKKWDGLVKLFAPPAPASRCYVFCDLFLNPDIRTTIRALIAAMRQWQVIPKAIIFDNGSAFKGNLLSAFCERAGIRLIHTAVYHPQTNGKLERAFRDDMRDYYKQHTPWLFEPLRRELPAYVHYRNYVR